MMGAAYKKFLIIRWYHSLIWIIYWCLWMFVFWSLPHWLSFIFRIKMFLYWNVPKMLHLYHCTCSKCGWFLQILKVHDCGVCDVENAMLGLFSPSGYICDFWAQQIWWLRCLWTVIQGIVCESVVQANINWIAFSTSEAPPLYPFKLCERVDERYCHIVCPAEGREQKSGAIIGILNFVIKW